MNVSETIHSVDCKGRRQGMEDGLLVYWEHGNRISFYSRTPEKYDAIAAFVRIKFKNKQPINQ